jgi:hypothetical protein
MRFESLSKLFFSLSPNVTTIRKGSFRFANQDFGLPHDYRIIIGISLWSTILVSFFFFFFFG